MRDKTCVLGMFMCFHKLSISIAVLCNQNTQSKLITSTQKIADGLVLDARMS